MGVQSLALKLSGGRTVKSESNFHSSLGRIQAGAQGRPEVMLLGSSITGRLPDRAQGYEGWANMGCDGGTAVDVLRAMQEGILPVAPTLVIEANTLHRALGETETEVADAMRSPWFAAGLRISPVASYARPAAFLYSPLLAIRTGGFRDVETKQALGVSSRPQRVPDRPSPRLAAAEKRLAQELAKLVNGLREKGSEVVVVWLPPGRNHSPEPPPWILEWCRRSSIPYWDLGQDANPDLIRLTDGIHMDAASAARTMRSLRRAIPLTANAK